MELFSIYRSVYMVYLIAWGYQSLTLRSYAIVFSFAGGIWLALFLLQSFGLYRMAKNAGKPHKWLAFVPFLNLCYMTKLSGPCTVFGHTMRRSGLYAMIAQIVVVLLEAVAVVAEVLLFTKFRSALVFDPAKDEIGIALETLPLKMQRFYAFSQYASYFSEIAALIYTVLIVITTTGLYKAYAPKNVFPLTILTAFIPLSRCIVIFVLRNRKATDYEAYMRQAREAYYRAHAPYGSPYQPPYGGGSQNTPPPNTPPPAPDPFEEFSDGGDASSGDKSGEDDLFD